MSVDIAHLFVCIVPIPECWNETKDIRGLGGVAHNVTSLDECKTKCIDISNCVAIDWQPSSAGVMLDSNVCHYQRNYRKWIDHPLYTESIVSALVTSLCTLLLT